ncbi:MAG: DUF2383 domain-containing protein [Phycisphaerae bacterium]|nr:DUF2383 domain-containing protein [Phycisphaerae bacterium]
MANQEMIDNLSSLAQVDIDAVHAYDQAIDQIDADDEQIREKLIEYRQDHQRHVAELASEIRDLGGTPPEYSRDFKGFLIEGFTALRSLTGTEGALKAMKSNEGLTNRRYDEARTWHLTGSAKGVVERGFQDEQAHLQFIEETLHARVG